MTANRIIFLLLLAILLFQIGRTVWLSYQEGLLLSDRFSPDMPSCEVAGYHLNWTAERAWYCESGK